MPRTIAQNEVYDKIFEGAEKNRKWFEKNRKKLLHKYPEEFVVICEGKVVANDPNFDKVLKKIPSDCQNKEHSIEYLSKEGIELVL